MYGYLTTYYVLLLIRYTVVVNVIAALLLFVQPKLLTESFQVDLISTQRSCSEVFLWKLRPKLHSYKTVTRVHLYDDVKFFRFWQNVNLDTPRNTEGQISRDYNTWVCLHDTCLTNWNNCSPQFDFKSHNNCWQELLDRKPSKMSAIRGTMSETLEIITTTACKFLFRSVRKQG